MAFCRHCGADGAGTFCASCGRPQAESAGVDEISSAVAAMTARPVPRQRAGFPGKVVVAFVGCLMFFGGIVYCVSKASDSASTGRSVPKSGALVSIVGSSCPAMPSENLWKEMHGSMTMGDTRGATRVLLSRGGRFLEPGTPVMVRDVSVFSGCAEITVQGNGSDMGEKWFVAFDCLPK